MGKRSKFDRNSRDYYPTPLDAVRPLLPHLPDAAWFVEPCAGRGDLITALEAAGHKCCGACDIHPLRHDVRLKDAMHADAMLKDGDYIITNPPWDRKILHPMIDHFRQRRPTWLLFDADWAHTKQAAPFLEYCRKIVSVGRVKWIADSPHTGKDNAAWYLFDAEPQLTQFFGREAA